MMHLVFTCWLYGSMASVSGMPAHSPAWASQAHCFKRQAGYPELWGVSRVVSALGLQLAQPLKAGARLPSFSLLVMHGWSQSPSLTISVVCLLPALSRQSCPPPRMACHLRQEDVWAQTAASERSIELRGCCCWNGG